MNQSNQSTKLFKCAYCKCFNNSMLNHLDDKHECMKKYSKSRQKLNNKYDCLEILGGIPILQIQGGFYSDARFSANNIFNQLNNTDIKKTNKYFITTKQISLSNIN